MGKYFKNWAKTRTVAFYICIVVAVLSVVGAVYYIATVNGLEGDSGPLDLLKWPAVYCAIIGAVAFIILSLFNLANYGAAAMGILDLIAFCLVLSPEVVAYVASNIMGEYAQNILALPGLLDIAISAVIFLVAAILSNVFAWVHLKKHPKKNKKKKDQDDAQPGGGQPAKDTGKELSQNPASPAQGQNSPYGNPYGGYGNPYGGSYNNPYGGYGNPYGGNYNDPYNGRKW